MLQGAITKMEQMFRKYWDLISYLYNFDFILDSRWRVESYLKVLEVMESNMKMAEGTSQAICNDATEKFYAFYKTYEEEFRSKETQPLDVLPISHPLPVKCLIVVLQARRKPAQASSSSSSSPASQSMEIRRHLYTPWMNIKE